jgi:hypothetical protein
MALSASLVARGHHSFYEVQMIADRLGFKIKDGANRQQYYEQFLTAAFKQSTEYQQFINSGMGKEYLESYALNSKATVTNRR